MGLDGLEYLGRADLGSSRNAVALKGIGHQALSISLVDYSSPDSSQTGLREVPATVELTGQCKISGAATRVTRSRIVLSSVTAVPCLAPNRRSIMLSGPWHSVASSHQQTSARRSTAAEAPSGTARPLDSEWGVRRSCRGATTHRLGPINQRCWRMYGIWPC